MHARLDVGMLDELDLVARTAELAKTFGIDWYSVVARGSQYRVEGMLARLAHTQNFLLVRSPPSHVACPTALLALSCCLAGLIGDNFG